MSVTPWERCYVKGCNEPSTLEHEVMQAKRDGVETAVWLRYCAAHWAQAVAFKWGRRPA